MLVGQLFELSGKGGWEGVNTCIPKQTYIPVLYQDARACVCVFVCVCRVSGTPFPSSRSVYILDTYDLFVLLCHMLGVSSIRVDWFPSLIKLHFRYACNDW